MGIGPQALHLLSIVNNIRFKRGSVIELGAQELHKGLPSFTLDFPIQKYHQYRNINDKELNIFNKMNVQNIYNMIGFNYYKAIDLNNLNNSLKLDLNKKISNPKLKNNFQLVTNFGTSEHLINQENFFFNAHYLCKKGGLMIGIVPYRRSKRHGFFKYDSLFFLSLAKANGYDINLYISYTNVNCYGFTLLEYSENIEDEIQKYERIFSIKPSTTDDYEIGYILKKKNNRKFVIPTQIYDDQFALSSKKLFRYKNKYKENIFKFFLIYGKGKLIFRLIRLIKKIRRRIK